MTGSRMLEAHRRQDKSHLAGPYSFLYPFPYPYPVIAVVQPPRHQDDSLKRVVPGS
jgi:hypothetical protein